MNNEFPFLNPIVVFENFLNAGQQFEDQLPSLQKKLLTEISLSEAGFILINGHEFTKDRILKLFEGYKTFSNWNYFLELKDDEAFTSFLTLPENSENINFNNSELYKAPDFVAFINPCFRIAFIRYVTFNLNNSNNQKLSSIFQKISFLGANDLLLAYTEINESLMGMVMRMDEFQKQFRSDRSIEITEEYENEILGTTSTEFINAINVLPPDFSLFINEYSVAAINLGVAIPQRKLELKRLIMKNLTLLKTEPEYAKLIQSNHKAISKSTFINIKEDGLFWTIVRIIIVGGVMSLKLGNC